MVKKVISSLILLESVEASVIVRQMNVESLARQATLDLDENGTSDLFMRMERAIFS